MGGSESKSDDGKKEEAGHTHSHVEEKDGHHGNGGCCDQDHGHEHAHEHAHSHEHAHEHGHSGGGCCDKGGDEMPARMKAATEKKEAGQSDVQHEHSHGGGGCCDKEGDEMPARMKAALELKAKEQAEAEKKKGLATPAPEVLLMVNGINCGGCKKAVDAKLRELPGVTSTDITTKKDSGVHPNKVVVKGAVDAEQVKLALAELDAGRGKYTIEESKMRKFMPHAAFDASGDMYMPHHFVLWPEVSLMVNGINCGGCKKAVDAKLRELPGVTSIDITTKKDSGVHPNKVVVKGATDAEQVKLALAELDAGRGKYTIEV